MLSLPRKRESRAQKSVEKLHCCFRSNDRLHHSAEMLQSYMNKSSLYNYWKQKELQKWQKPSDASIDSPCFGE